MRPRLIFSSLAIFLAGCASPLPQPVMPRGNSAEATTNGSATTDPSVRRGNRPPSSSSAPRRNAASAVLLDQSRDARTAENYTEAAAAVERALSIDPNNAALWIELAEIRSAEGNRDQADSLARKALTLAGNDRSIIVRAERLVGL